MFIIHVKFPDSENQFFLGRGDGLTDIDSAQTYETVDAAQIAMARVQAKPWVRSIGRRQIQVQAPIVTLMMI